ncbi:hypothetical protein, partial [Agathobaculum sp. TL06]
EAVRFVKNFFQSFFQIFEPFFLFSELFRPPPLPKQLIQYIKPQAVCQELFSSFFSFFRTALARLVYYTISPAPLSIPFFPFPFDFLRVFFHSCHMLHLNIDTFHGIIP